MFFNEFVRDGNAIIPYGVEEISYCAFRCFLDLTSVEIPNSVTSIGESAFECCGLTNIEIPDSVTSICEGAFGWCSGLTSIKIYNSVTKIGDEAFEHCKALTDIYIDAIQPDSPVLFLDQIENKTQITLHIRGEAKKLYCDNESFNSFKAVIADNWE